MKRILSILFVLVLTVSLFPAALAEEPLPCIRLNLNLLPSAGLGWDAEVADPEIAFVDGDGFPEEAAEDTSGLPIFTVLRIYGVNEGSTDVTLSYRSQNDPAAEPLYSLTLHVSVETDLSLSLNGQISLPDPGGYAWYPVQENPDAIQVTQESESAFTAQALADGTDMLYFILVNEDMSEHPCAFLYEAVSEAGRVETPVIWFSLVIPEGLLPGFHPAFTFSTTDLEGNPVTEQDLAGNKLTILNFWEPWCGPCVGEMPDLQRLSQDYADKGLVIYGIYATPDSEEDVREVLEATGVTYPILHYVKEFGFLQTGYVPTTVVLDEFGQIIVRPFSGAVRYSSWVELLEQLL